jgi:hypothetical protein
MQVIARAQVVASTHTDQIDVSDVQLWGEFDSGRYAHQASAKATSLVKVWPRMAGCKSLSGLARI